MEEKVAYLYGFKGIETLLQEEGDMRQKRKLSAGGKNRFKKQQEDFPGSPVVKTSPSNARGVGSIPVQGTKIPRASWAKKQEHAKKQCCNKLNKDFKDGPHRKNLRRQHEVCTLLLPYVSFMLAVSGLHTFS